MNAIAWSVPAPLLTWPGLNAPALLAYVELSRLSGSVPSVVGIHLAEFGKSLGGSKSAARRWLRTLADVGLVEAVDSARGTWRLLDAEAEAKTRGLRVVDDPQKVLFETVPDPAQRAGTGTAGEVELLQRFAPQTWPVEPFGTQNANIRTLRTSNVSMLARPVPNAADQVASRCDWLSGRLYAARVAGVFQWLVTAVALAMETDALWADGSVCQLSEADVESAISSTRVNRKGGRYFLGALRCQLGTELPKFADVAEACRQIGLDFDDRQKIPYERLRRRA